MTFRSTTALPVALIFAGARHHRRGPREGQRQVAGGIPDPDYPTEMRNERGKRLREFLRDEGDVFGYEYDFGDSWEHDLVFVRIVTSSEVTDAVCLEGERSCPPEDVVGCPDCPGALKDI